MSWYVSNLNMNITDKTNFYTKDQSYPTIMVFSSGILTVQGSPPSLQFICMATFVATDIKPFGLLRTVAVIT